MISEFIIASTMFLFSCFMFFQTTQFNSNNISFIGPAYWPRVILGTMIILSAILLFRIYKNRDQIKTKEDEEENSKIYPQNFWITIGISLLYTLVMPILGFPVSTLIMIIAMLWILKVRKIKYLIVLSFVMCLGLIVLFPKILAVPLPRGTGVFRMISLFFY